MAHLPCVICGVAVIVAGSLVIWPAKLCIHCILLWVTKRLSSVLEFTAMQLCVLCIPPNTHSIVANIDLFHFRVFIRALSFAMISIMEWIMWNLFFHFSFTKTFSMVESCGCCFHALQTANQWLLITFRDEAMLFAQLCVFGEFRWGNKAGLP